MRPGLGKLHRVLQAGLITSQGKANWWFYYQLLATATTILVVIIFARFGLVHNDDGNGYKNLLYLFIPVESSSACSP